MVAGGSQYVSGRQSGHNNDQGDAPTFRGSVAASLVSRVCAVASSCARVCAL